MFHTKCESAKITYYENIVSELKNSNPGQWYSKLKRMTSHDQLKSEKVIVENICHLSDTEQVEIIADNLSRVSNKYDKICLRQENEKPTPKFEAHQVFEYLKRIKTNNSTVKNYIPAKIITEFAYELSEPFADILTCMVTRGEFPDI